MTAAAIVAGTANSSADVSGGALSHACALPASIAAGDLLFLVVGVWGPSGLGVDLTPSAPSGWTSLFDDLLDDFAYLLGFRIAYKVAAGSEGSTASVSWTGAGATSVVAISARITGADASSPIDTFAVFPYASNPSPVTVNGAKLDSLLLRGIVYAYPQTDPTTTFGHTALTGTSGGAYNARNYGIWRTWTAAGSTGSTLYFPGPDGAGAYSYTVAIAPSASSLSITTTTLAQTPTFGLHDVAGANAITTQTLAQTPTFGLHTVTAANTDQSITTTVLAQTPTFGLHTVVGAAAQTITTTTLVRTPTFGLQTVVPVVPFLGRSQVIPWGASRRWNAWVEFHVGGQLVASSANGDFALVGGRITEDISRPIRRDVQVALMFPTGQTLATGAVYSAAETSGSAVDWDSTGTNWDSPSVDWNEQTAGASPFTVGESEVGGSDVLGGSGIGSPTVLIPAQRAVTTRSVYIPTAVGDLLDPNSPTVMVIWAGFWGEEVLMGTFDLSSVPVRVTEGGATIEVTGHSFERRIAKAGFWEVEAALTGTNVALAAASLVVTALPDVQVSSVINNTGIADLTWKPGDNRLSKVTDLLTTGGLEGGFDRDNHFVIAEAPSIGDFGTALPRWEVVDGINARIATLNAATRDFSDEDSYNGVVIEGDSHDSTTTAPVVYTLWNTNPASPLYFDPDDPTSSLTGPRPKYVRSELVRTVEDAVAVAQAELAKVLMISDSVEAEVVANASIEMGHFARVASEGLGLDGVYRVIRVTHDLEGGPASLSLYRYQQV